MPAPLFNINSFKDGFYRHLSPFVYKKKSLFSTDLSFSKFFTILSEISSLEFLIMNIGFSAFICINMMGLFKAQFNAVNNQLRDEKAGRLKKIMTNLGVLLCAIVLTGVITAISMVISLHLSIILSFLAFLKLIHHTRQYFKLRAYDITDETSMKAAIADQKYHRNRAIESLLTMGAGVALFFYPPASIAALSVTGALVACSIYRHLPAAIKIISGVINSIIYPDSRPWKDLDEGTIQFVPPGEENNYSSLRKKNNSAEEPKNVYSEGNLARTQSNTPLEEEVAMLEDYPKDSDIAFNEISQIKGKTQKNRQEKSLSKLFCCWWRSQSARVPERSLSSTSNHSMSGIIAP